VTTSASIGALGAVEVAGLASMSAFNSAPYFSLIRLQAPMELTEYLYRPDFEAQQPVIRIMIR
jgi:hypothetical protein